MPYSQIDSPKGLTESGKPPETRLGTAEEVKSRVQLLQQGELEGRSQRRALVKGLVDGNPPYRPRDLRNAGRADACNVNWRVAESYLYSARNAFYDLRSEAPTFVTVKTSLGGPARRKEWSDIITEEFQRLILKYDYCFDYEMQISDHEMTLYGCGPQIFEDNYCYESVAVPCKHLLVPEFALSRPDKWEEAAVIVDYYSHDLYKRIRNEDAARKMGWEVANVKQAIMDAHPLTRNDSTWGTWEWHQQLLKNNSLSYQAESNIIKCAHYYVREFQDGADYDDEGKITHCIVQIGEHGEETDFLFKHIGRFDNWRQVIHPFYYDNDGGGYHHSVTGLGVKMFSAMEFQNRLLCNMADKAFAPKVFFKPTTANGAEILNIIKMGDWAKVPPGFDAMQIPVGSFLEEPMALNREISGMIASNLSQYRQNLSKTQGNPLTATEVEMRASEQARLGKTQLNHYYAQADCYYAEKYRRAAEAKNRNLPGGKASYEFQKWCTDRGVPIEAVRQTEWVGMTRIAGQGSPFLRQQAMMQLINTSMMNPSSAGKLNIYKDLVASLAGQMMVQRYVPEIVNFEASNQKAFATLQVSAARNGVPAVFSPDQAHEIFAQTFFEAIGMAFESLGQGADPQQVLGFVDALGGALIQHIQAMSQDPRLAEVAKEFQKQWMKVAQMADKLKAQIQVQQQQQAEAMQMRQRAAMMNGGGDPELQLKAAESRGKLQIQAEKQRGSMALKAQKTQQDMALADARTSSEITLQARKTNAEIVNQTRKTEAATTTED